MAFRGITRDLGSFGEETDEMANLHQILEEVLLTARGDGVTGITRRRRDPSGDGSIFSMSYLFRNPFSSTTMGYENPICALGDYSKSSHEGYRNTIELPVGNNVLPLRFDTIRLVQNGCSFHELRSKDPNQHLKDFLILVDSFDLDGGNRERTRLPHTKRMEIFKNAIFKQHEEINDRMTEMFSLLKELTTSKTPKKVLVRKEAKFFVTKNGNSTSLARGEEETSDKIDVAYGKDIENPTRTEMGMQVKEAKKNNEARGAC
uniref:MAK10-like protein n=1 Tax=Tanacetum cinerariifolium TaxID=118510 RepID=A0A6L2LZW3_TANCI|nr:MAK10-like protein [Tanacetum cinerariifolium]